MNMVFCSLLQIWCFYLYVCVVFVVSCITPFCIEYCGCSCSMICWDYVMCNVTVGMLLLSCDD
jgi:hypothetical protein